MFGWGVLSSWEHVFVCDQVWYREDLAQVIRNTDQSDLFPGFSYRAQCHNKYMHVDSFYHKLSDNSAWLHCVVKELVKFVRVNSNTGCISSCKCTLHAHGYMCSTVESFGSLKSILVHVYQPILWIHWLIHSVAVFLKLLATWYKLWCLRLFFFCIII